MVIRKGSSYEKNIEFIKSTSARGGGAEPRIAFTLAEVFSPHCAGSRKTAFTLAEVLITLGIIGIVAALTMPLLIRNYNRKVYVNHLKKVYNTINNGFDLYMAKNGADNIKDAGMNSQADLDEMVPKYFHVVKTCDEADLESCMLAQDQYQKLNGNNITYQKVENGLYGFSPVYGTKTYVLSDGSSVRFKYSNGDIIIVVDVNGKAGPNIQGKDLFTMKRFFNNTFGDWHTFEYGCCDGSSMEGGVRVGGCFSKVLELNWHLTDSNYCPRFKY